MEELAKKVLDRLSSSRFWTLVGGTGISVVALPDNYKVIVICVLGVAYVISETILKLSKD